MTLGYLPQSVLLLRFEKYNPLFFMRPKGTALLNMSYTTGKVTIAFP